jgi:hypothetical protein
VSPDFSPRSLITLVLGLFLLAGCDDDNVVAPRHTSPPAAPRGLQSITGDTQVYLSWLANTESRVAGYRIYGGDCAGGQGCPYDKIGSTTATTFVVDGLTNGRTKYFAVSAVDGDGNESDLSYDTIFDTPRPEGTGLALANYLSDSLHAGYDFSGYAIRSYTSPLVDIFYGASGSQALMIAPFSDTEIQDAGYATTLDAVDFAPAAGWSPTGTVELITGHCYVVWTNDNHFAKFRVTSLTGTRVVVDWGYQVAVGNRELQARPDSRRGGSRQPRPGVWEILTSLGAS